MAEWSKDLLGVRTYSETYNTESISSGALTLDLSKALNFEVTLSADITSITISNVPSGSTTFGIIFVGDGTQRSVTWPESVSWPSGNAPLITSTNGVRDFLAFISLNNGTDWYGFVSGQVL